MAERFSGDGDRLPSDHPVESPESVLAPFPEGDPLFLIAEQLARDFSLFPQRTTVSDKLRGLLTPAAVRTEIALLRRLDIDAYIERCVTPAEDPSRTSAPAVIQMLGEVRDVDSDGPFYSAVLDLDFGYGMRQLGVIAQDRTVRNGEWMPSHHLAAAKRVDEYSKRRLPIVCFMDTPGAAADEAANRNNQAHSISRLLAEMCNVDVPNLGVIFGIGYSGGAIPLASANLILAVRDGVFNTIAPRGLANIARRYDLSWQECAKLVGISAVELMQQGNVDGVIDYTPSSPNDKLENLRLAIVSGIRSIEDRVKEFVAENPYIIDHYQRSLQRYLNPSPRLQVLQTSASLSLTASPTEYHNVFGVTYRYLRYLSLRRRIRTTTRSQYGRLSQKEIPQGRLGERSERERRQAFLAWLQDPEKLLYDDGLAKAWKSYQEKKADANEERSRVAQFFFGEPRRNYEEAKGLLVATVGMYLFNRWKNDAGGNLRALGDFLVRHDETRLLLRVGDLVDPVEFAQRLGDSKEPAVQQLRAQMGFEASKLLRGDAASGAGEQHVRAVMTTELNLAMTAGALFDPDSLQLSVRTRQLLADGANQIAVNRSGLNDFFPAYLPDRSEGIEDGNDSESTVLDLLLDDDLREDCIIECVNLQMFDAVYDNIISRLDSVAEEADKSHALSQQTVGRLMQVAVEHAAKAVGKSNGTGEVDREELQRINAQLNAWFLRFTEHPRRLDFLRSVEEWKKGAFPFLSDTLFVVVTFLLEKLIPSFLDNQQSGRRFDGRITPRHIGRRKDFWNRLTIAYRDLLIQNLLTAHKRRGSAGHQQFLDLFFSDFEEIGAELLSADPVRFPGFRIALETALEKGLPPCGSIAGVGRFKLPSGEVRIGTIISNVAFQAGAFDMASAEKFCELLVRCSQERLPVVCFISSGGMQTKEGAAALFPMAVINDRVTRFVRDNDLPVTIFGFGDCTGGAQASFVTHPLVQTYYFSGTSMPFAGQIVVPSNLPSTAILSNYLSSVPGAMQGLVKHPFLPELDSELRRIDPDIPTAQETVTEVVERILEGRLAGRRAAVPFKRPAAASIATTAPIRRVIVHARGCTAVKLIRAAQQLKIEVVLVQSDPDMESVAADMMRGRDRVVCIGGNTPDESYLNAMSVVRVAENEQADALHPGIGFLSESAQFAQLCRAHGLNFIGPPVAAMETMGNKSNAIAAARRMNVPVVPGSHGILTDVERANEVAEQIGYPLLIKAVHGGGGKGIQVVERNEDFVELFHRVTAEARSAFGNGDVYLEKLVQRLRHIEVQVLRDTAGNTRVLGLRDCSVQRDKQKVLEESGSTMLSAALTQSVMEYAGMLAEHIAYVGAGTVEFIYDLDNECVYFMEMNTRLQVEHPVTELVSGIDIVAEQFRIAAGSSVADLAIGQNGYAIEARVNAERIVLDGGGKLVFRPVPGRIESCRWAVDPRVMVISSVADGKWIPPYYDSMVAQIIAHGRDREEAILILRDFLARSSITGVVTNIPLLLRILDDDQFRCGEFSTGYLPQLLSRLDAGALIEDMEKAAGSTGASIDAKAIQIEGTNELKVLSQSSGVFYLTPSPSEPPFVAVGDVVEVSQIVCQIEAMKVFAPLRLADFNAGLEEPLYSPERRYRVKRVNLANAQQVNAGDLLFVVEPV